MYLMGSEGNIDTTKCNGRNSNVQQNVEGEIVTTKVRGRDSNNESSRAK